MKVVKVHIRRGKVGQPMMVYPARYNAEEVDRNGLGPCGVNGTGAYSGHIGRGRSEEWCYILLDDALADEYAQDPEMEIVDDATADADMEAWRIANHETEIVVKDQELVRVAKEKAPGARTPDDLAALDPDNPMPGINKRLRKVAAIVADAGQTLTRPPRG